MRLLTFFTLGCTFTLTTITAAQTTPDNAKTDE